MRNRSRGQTPLDQDGTLICQNVTEPGVRPYLVPDAGRHPAVVVCPGGGYGKHCVNKEGSEVAAWLNRQGFHAFVLRYRVPDNRADAFCDVQRAIRTVRARASGANCTSSRRAATAMRSVRRVRRTATGRLLRPAGCEAFSPVPIAIEIDARMVLLQHGTNNCIGGCGGMQLRRAGACEEQCCAAGEISVWTFPVAALRDGANEVSVSSVPGAVKTVWCEISLGEAGTCSLRQAVRETTNGVVNGLDVEIDAAGSA